MKILQKADNFSAKMAKVVYNADMALYGFSTRMDGTMGVTMPNKSGDNS